MPGTSYAGELPPLTPEQDAAATRIGAEVALLAGDIGVRNLEHPEALARTVAHLAESFTAAGYEVHRDPFLADGKTCENLWVELNGVSRDLVVVGAHYDTARNTPGADDNASGVAALLELARRLHGRKSARTVRLVAWGNEEPPWFQNPGMGSLAEANALAAAATPVYAAFSLESIGYYDDAPHSQKYPFPFDLFYPNKGNFVAFIGNTRSRWLVRESLQAFRDGVDFPSEGAAVPGGIPGVGWSDHWSYWQQGWPAVMVTGTAPFRDPHYHRPTDVPAVVDATRVARVVDGLEAVVARIAGVEDAE